MRRHHEDADAYADAITELYRAGYPQSSPKLRQELINEQFIRGQSDPELNKYLWVVIRTQKELKLQTLIEVCTDFASLGQATTVHRPAEQVFALEEDEEPEDLVAMIDRSQWTGPGISEPQLPPTLQQMFTLAHRMGYEMRPIARRTETACQTSRSPRTPGQGYRTPFRPDTIILRLNATAAVRCDTRKLAAQSRTHRSRSDQMVRMCRLMVYVSAITVPHRDLTHTGLHIAHLYPTSSSSPTSLHTSGTPPHYIIQFANRYSFYHGTFYSVRGSGSRVINQYLNNSYY